MKKYVLFVLIILSLNSFASEDKVTCADKNNVLKYLITDDSGYPGYYSYVYLVSLKEQTLGTGRTKIKMAPGDTLSLYDTDVINHNIIEFKTKLIEEGQKSLLDLPAFTIDLTSTKTDAHEATVLELESLGNFEVICQAIPIEDHMSQLGRYNAEHRLLKALD